MSVKGDFFRLLDVRAHTAQTVEECARLDQLVELLIPLAEAAVAGNEAEADRLVADLQARALLSQVFPGWELGTLGAGAE